MFVVASVSKLHRCRIGDMQLLTAKMDMQTDQWKLTVEPHQNTPTIHKRQIYSSSERALTRFPKGHFVLSGNHL